jgi:hypothetical protein
MSWISPLKTPAGQVWSSGFSRSGVDRLESGEFPKRRVFFSNALNIRPLAA